MLEALLILSMWLLGFVCGMSIAVDEGAHKPVKTRRKYFLMAVAWPFVFTYFLLWIITALPKRLYEFLTKESY